MTLNENIAARAGRWSAQHRKKAIFGWLAFVVLAVVGGGAVGTNTLDDDARASASPADADRLVANAFPDEASRVRARPEREAR